ncbi:hypothetical protein [Pseudohoeflea coraliihabitans]|uniref:Dehydrogenase (DH) domain-containing protein n=1 Tax=Pseudohoeflea coraliihabitans TaxID=2860393 RepID=A0ABS6WSQ3_9HYPH|nr:hypothetical protein [Pseudohoeflea sp. DP4N28-3]MBW3098971.1 hypothetical protein [Pseudohoeflea sp. DP4N28-3]
MFDCPIEESGGVLSGPVRQPLQMLSEQEYGHNGTIHDDATARSVGFEGGTIEGPTHFSQFVPLCHALWGDDWLARGCLSARYRAPAYEGDSLRAFLRRPDKDGAVAEIWMQRDDGTEILRGTASLGPDFHDTALTRRLAELSPARQPVILSNVEIGARVPRLPVRLDADRRVGKLYPFSLADKLRRITEPSPLYTAAQAPWDRPLVPFEMISVLMQHSWEDRSVDIKGPAVGLFADQEIRLLDGPVFVGEDYEVDREVVFLSESRRTESVWIRTRLLRPGSDEVVAEMLLNCAFMKESYAPYESERKALYGG